ncbi:hypothetical protein BDW59DRAFT_159469 [Aspergillus cavernicola]|uniref:Uncharacterized protein n=1 Tax=Aspergillus cavernicola TaxID=176166 RepID=A0ABR4ILL7_9EURO
MPSELLALGTKLAAKQAAEWSTENPVLAASAVGVLVAPALTVPALSAIGFGTLGVQAGLWSIAASMQSTIGNPVVGGVFATMQSAGAGGAGLAVVNGVVQAGVGAKGMGTTAWEWIKAFNRTGA